MRVKFYFFFFCSSSIIFEDFEHRLGAEANMVLSKEALIPWSPQITEYNIVTIVFVKLFCRWTSASKAVTDRVITESSDSVKDHLIEDPRIVCWCMLWDDPLSTLKKGYLYHVLHA